VLWSRIRARVVECLPVYDHWCVPIGWLKYCTDMEEVVSNS